MQTYELYKILNGDLSIFAEGCLDDMASFQAFGSIDACKRAAAVAKALGWERIALSDATFEWVAFIGADGSYEHCYQCPNT